MPEPKNPAAIYVTRPELPSLPEFIPYLQEIWDSKVLTNGGQFHHQFEQNLCDYLGVKHIALFTNATIGLVTALQALRITGEVITTPYSFVATAHSLLWNGIKPVFVDIDPVTLCIDLDKAESLINPRTRAIIAMDYDCLLADHDRVARLGPSQRHPLKVPDLPPDLCSSLTSEITMPRSTDLHMS